jgi:ubiquitin C-terminal hydrolase
VATQSFLGRLVSDHGSAGIAELVSENFFFHQRVLMNGQPTADSGEACTVISNIDTGQQREDSLARFFAEEELTTESENGRPEQQRKMIVLDTVPAVLILDLNRFDVGELGRLAKNQHVITFLLEVDLQDLIPGQPDRDLNHRLTAIAKHRGMDIDHAHSIAICRINGQWWTFDDREVHLIANVMDEETMLFERTAMLLYELMHPGEM